MGGAQCLNVQQIKAQNTKSHLQPGEDGGAGTGGADNRSEVGESRTTRCCPWEKKQEHKKHQLDQKCSRIIFCVPGLFSHSGWPRGWLGRGLEGQSGNLRWQLGFNRSLLPFSCLCLCLCFCLCLCLSSLFISSVRSSSSHPDLLLTHHHHHPTFSDHTGPQHWTFTFWATTAI